MKEEIVDPTNATLIYELFLFRNPQHRNTADMMMMI